MSVFNLWVSWDEVHDVYRIQVTDLRNDYTELLTVVNSEEEAAEELKKWSEYYDVDE